MVAVRLERTVARSAAVNPDRAVAQRSTVPTQEILAANLALALLDGDAAVWEHAIQMEEIAARMAITASLVINAF